MYSLGLTNKYESLERVWTIFTMHNLTNTHTHTEPDGDVHKQLGYIKKSFVFYYGCWMFRCSIFFLILSRLFNHTKFSFCVSSKHESYFVFPKRHACLSSFHVRRHNHHHRHMKSTTTTTTMKTTMSYQKQTELRNVAIFSRILHTPRTFF